MISLSILDYSPIDEGSNAHEALWHKKRNGEVCRHPGLQAILGIRAPLC